MNRAFLLPKLQLRSVRGKGKNDLRRAASMHQQTLRSAFLFCLGCQQRAQHLGGGRTLPPSCVRRVTCGDTHLLRSFALAQLVIETVIPVNFFSYKKKPILVLPHFCSRSLEIATAASAAAKINTTQLNSLGTS